MERNKYIILSDIDGVIADCEHRLHLMREKKYDEFYFAAASDKANQTAIDFLKALIDKMSFYGSSTPLYFVTGRPERIRDLTALWLDVKFGSYYYDGIIMRKDEDWRPSEVVKPQMVRDYFMEKNMPEKHKILFKKKALAGMTSLFNADKVIYIDDDPKNCVAMKEAFPEIVPITYGTDRMV